MNQIKKSMKKFNLLLKVLVALFFINKASSQVPDSAELLGLHKLTTAEMNSIANPIIGTLLYNTTENKTFIYSGSSWVDILVLPADLIDGDDVDDADADASNEIQTLSISGNNLTISGPGGNIVTLPTTVETLTNFSQNTGTGAISYTNESNTVQTANIISGDANNLISSGTDGGTYVNNNLNTTTIIVDQSFLWTGQVNDSDIHANNTLTVQQLRADTGWAFAAPSTITYTGSPDHVKIDLMAVVNNTGDYYATPHIKVFRNGNEIGEGSYRYFNNNTSYSGRGTVIINLTDPNPGTNPVYTFTTLEDDTRNMNNATIPDLSPMSLIAVNKVSVISSVSFN